tara:strand:+ start:646 stop:840 length:195 start_codon:yes stop_codon:yes gene_type:complete
MTAKINLNKQAKSQLIKKLLELNLITLKSEMSNLGNDRFTQDMYREKYHEALKHYIKIFPTLVE